MMCLAMQEIADFYNIFEINELSSLIDIDNEKYTIIFGNPVFKECTKYEVEIKLKDRYGQGISKMIQYDLIAKWQKKYIKYKKPEKSQVFLAF